MLDRWFTRHLAAVDASLWPAGGLRLVLDSQAGPLLVLAVPSTDRVGRAFPLAAVALADGADASGAETWAAAAFALLAPAAAGLPPDAVAEGLASLGPPAPGATPLRPPLAWTCGEAPDDPGDLGRHFTKPSSG